MAHGYPDYGLAAALQNIYSVVDLGELAARLGSPLIVDRRGHMLLLDSFAEGLGRWGQNGSLAGDVVSLDVGHGSADAYAALLTTDAGATNDLNMFREVGYTPGGRVGFQFQWTPIFRLLYIYGMFRFTGPGGTVNAGWKFAPSSGTLQIVDSSGVVATLGVGLGSVGSIAGYNSAKLIVDVTARRFVQLVWQGVAYNLSAYALDLDGVGVLSNLGMLVEVQGDSPFTSQTYVDDCVLTVDEP